MYNTITAKSGIDYSFVSIMLNFSSGIREVSLNISILDDNIYENAENFSVILTASNARINLVPYRRFVVIEDDDEFEIVMSLQDISSKFICSNT